MNSISNSLDPSFVAELQAMARDYSASQNEADNCSWVIAEKVNDMWSEHKGVYYELTNEPVFPTKKEYYAECSRVANLALKRKVFSTSGETLRRWCEVQATYAQFDKSELFLDFLSFDHLAKAKKLYNDEKVKSPVLALAHAVQNSYTADEMKEHFDPSLPIHPYDKVTTWLDGMMNRDSWQWLKSRKTIDGILYHAAEIRKLISEDK